MKLLSRCPVCGDEEPVKVPIQLRDDGTADATCPVGHAFVVVSPHEKYEILFDSAALALLDGYAREAVMGFAGALDQFFAFFIELARCHLQYNSTPSDEITATWKQVARQSERQLGAFLYLHLLISGKAYHVDPKAVEFRNKVVHGGYLPTLEEAKSFGERVWNNIATTVQSFADEDGILDLPITEDEIRLEKYAGPADRAVIVSHVVMLDFWTGSPGGLAGGFAERLFRLRTTERRAVYGRGPKGDA